MQTVLSPPTTLWCADGLAASIDGPGLQQTYRIDKPYLLIGSSPKADIVLPILESSPVALYLHVTDDSIAWLDLSSPTGQWRSGAFAKTGCLVWRGYHIALERIKSNDRHATSFDSSKPSLLPDDRPADVPVFNIEFDGAKLARAKLTSTMTLVGQSSRCRLRLCNRHVSYDHCLFYVANQRAWVIDLLSDEGTFVHGQRIAAAAVGLDDIVTVGKPNMSLVRWSTKKSTDSPPHQSSDSGIDLDSSHHAPSDGASPIEAPTSPETTEPQELLEAIETVEPVQLPDATSTIEATTAELPTDTNAAELSTELAPAPVSPEAPTRSLTDTTVESASLRDTVIDVAIAQQIEPQSDDEQPADGDQTKVSEALSQISQSPAPSPQSPVPIPRPLAPDPRPLLPDPSLDRLIDRHKVNHRRTLIRWSIASSIILAAFLSAVVWASRNIDFYDTEPALQLEPMPGAGDESKSIRRSTPPSDALTDEIAPLLNSPPQPQR